MRKYPSGLLFNGDMAYKEFGFSIIFRGPYLKFDGYLDLRLGAFLKGTFRRPTIFNLNSFSITSSNLVS